METQPQIDVSALTPDDRRKLDELVLFTERLTVTVPRPVLRAVLEELDGLTEANAAILGQLCGAARAERGTPAPDRDRRGAAELEGIEAPELDAARAGLSHDLGVRMNQGYSTRVPVLLDDEVRYAAAADAREEMSLIAHKALARELLVWRAGSVARTRPRELALLQHELAERMHEIAELHFQLGRIDALLSSAGIVARDGDRSLTVEERVARLIGDRR